MTGCAVGALLACLTVSSVSCSRQSVPASAGGQTIAPASSAAPVPARIDAAGLLRLLSEHKGKPIVINVFASWCSPCRKELPDLARLLQQHPGFFLLGIDVDQIEADLVKFLPQVPKGMVVRHRPEGLHALLPVLHLPDDWNQSFPSDWMKTVPLTLVYDSSGEFQTGSVGQLTAEALSAIAEVVATAPAR